MPKLSISHASIDRTNEDVCNNSNETVNEKSVYNQIEIQKKNLVKLHPLIETKANAKKSEHTSTSKLDDTHDHSLANRKEENYSIFYSEDTEQTGSPNHIVDVKLNPPPLTVFEKTSSNDSCRTMRMEKKRKREMQRRSNVNKELDKLTSLIMALNPPELIKPANGVKTDFVSQPPLNRLELIQVAVKVLERLSSRSRLDEKKILELTAEVTTLRQALCKNDVSTTRLGSLI